MLANSRETTINTHSSCIKVLGWEVDLEVTKIKCFFIGLSLQAWRGGSFELLFYNIWPLESAIRIVLNLFFNLWTTFSTKQKSAQIRLKIAPIARTTSRAGQIWPQIIFLIFWKIQYLEPRVAPVCDPVPCPWNARPTSRHHGATANRQSSRCEAHASTNSK